MKFAEWVGRWTSVITDDWSDWETPGWTERYQLLIGAASNVWLCRTGVPGFQVKFASKGVTRQSHCHMLSRTTPSYWIISTSDVKFCRQCLVPTSFSSKFTNKNEMKLAASKQTLAKILPLLVLHYLWNYLEHLTGDRRKYNSGTFANLDRPKFFHCPHCIGKDNYKGNSYGICRACVPFASERHLLASGNIWVEHLIQNTQLSSSNAKFQPYQNIWITFECQWIKNSHLQT